MGTQTSRFIVNPQLGQYSITVPAQDKITEIGANPCPKLESKAEGPTPPTVDQTDPENTLAGNTEGNIEGNICPKFSQKSLSTLPAPQTPQDPESVIPLQKSKKIGANPCQNVGPPKQLPSHTTGNTHYPKMSPLENTTKK